MRKTCPVCGLDAWSQVELDQHAALPDHAPALLDRQQRAREAGQDHLTDYDAAPGIEAAIETATRVKITRDILLAAAREYPVVGEIVKAAFRAAGFEVEE